jgi:hypothetical protein
MMRQARHFVEIVCGAFLAIHAFPPRSVHFFDYTAKLLEG